jgi:hypothetical protein
MPDFTREEYFALLDRCNRRCAICDGLNGNRRLGVDRAPDGQVRGLLCRRCRSLLSTTQHDPRFSHKVNAYLAPHKE